MPAAVGRSWDISDRVPPFVRLTRVRGENEKLQDRAARGRRARHHDPRRMVSRCKVRREMVGQRRLVFGDQNPIFPFRPQKYLRVGGRQRQVFRISDAFDVENVCAAAVVSSYGVPERPAEVFVQKIT